MVIFFPEPDKAVDHEIRRRIGWREKLVSEMAESRQILAAHGVEGGVITKGKALGRGVMDVAGGHFYRSSLIGS